MDQEIIRYCGSASGCNGSTTALPGTMYTCNLCAKEVICTTSIRINASAEDLIGSLAVTLYSHNAAIFLGYPDELAVLDQIKGVQRPLRMLQPTGNNKEFTLLRLRAHGSCMNVFSQRFVASFADGLNVEEEVPAGTNNLSEVDTSQLLDALQAKSGQEMLDITPEEREILNGIICRRQLKGKLAESLVPVLHADNSESSSHTLQKMPMHSPPRQ